MQCKNILITGCSSGIGLASALGLHTRGYRVFATARTDEDLAMLENKGLTAISLDLANTDSVASCMERVKALSENNLHAVFHNGAYGQGGALEDLPREYLREQFEANFFGWHDLTRHIIPIMRKQGYGRIILNSSLLGYIALPLRGAYNASKFALEGWADTLRLELAGSNIAVILIEPGPIASKFRENSLSVFEKTIAPLIKKNGSAHQEAYTRMSNRLHSSKPLPFTLPSSAVAKKLVCALEASRPKTRYRVTLPSHLLWYLKRILSDRWLDRFLQQLKT